MTAFYLLYTAWFLIFCFYLYLLIAEAPRMAFAKRSPLATYRWLFPAGVTLLSLGAAFFCFMIFAGWTAS
jgi:hypothetical protein